VRELECIIWELMQQSRRQCGSSIQTDRAATKIELLSPAALFFIAVVLPFACGYGLRLSWNGQAGGRAVVAKQQK
jgi:hypothetical protein